ncbi:uncharacterized protein [Acropora muricata]|uniref:uncharacterized protein n=1 Tax=Acropora muricata TaxID=159855 RepID=UPI0034E59EF7
MPDQPWFRVNRDLLVYKAFYFFFLSGFGSIFPYLPVYFRQIGLPASQVGLLLGLRPIVQFASAPFWAIMADKYRKRKSVLVMSVLSWLIMTLTLAFVEPTNEICEIRQGNATHKHIVNYTKVKTGFFRRSIWHQAEVNTNMGEKHVDVVPIHIKSHNSKLSKILPRVNRPVITTKLNITQRQSTKGFESVNRNRTTFAPRKTSLHSFPRTPNEQQNDRLFQNSYSVPKNLEMNSKALISKDKTLRQRFDNTQEPRFKTIKNLTFHGKSIQNDSPWNENILSKHISRFYAGIKSQDQENGQKIPSNKFIQKAQEQRESSSGKPREKLMTSKVIKENLTSNLATPAKEGKNQNSTFDKRRESKGSPPVVIEFSRIFIPQGVNKNVGDSSPKDNIGNKNITAENLTKFVSQMHGLQPAYKTSHPNISDILKEISNEPTGTISKEKLLQLEDKFLKIGGLKSPNFETEQGTFVLGKNEEVSPVHFSSNQSSFVVHKPSLHIPVNDESENFSNDGDSKKFHDFKEKPTFVVHSGSAVLPAGDTTSPNGSTWKDNNSLKDELDSDGLANAESSGGSGLMAFGSSTSGNDVTNAKDRSQLIRVLENGFNKNFNSLPGFVRNIPDERYEGSAENSLNQTFYNISQSFQPSMDSGKLDMKEKPEINIMEESKATQAHLDKKLDSRSKIWMTNLLKTNSFELRRIFTILLVLVVVGEFLEAPSTTLADASLLEHLGEERRYYGKQRLWGSLGFGLSSFFVGVLLERSRHVVCGDPYTDYMICFCVFALLMIATLFISTTFKFKYKETDTTHASVLAALCNIHYGSCLAAACFMGVGHGMSHSFLNWFLEDLGATKTLMGVAVICRSTFDLLTFFVAGSLIKAVGQIKIMIFSLISYGIAFTLYSLLANPWLVLPIEMLVGSTYAASWSACTSYMAGAASSESVTTIQGVLQGVYWGLGTGSGTIAGGFLIHHIGAVATFRCVACCAFVVCVLFCLAQFRWTKETAESRHLDFEYTYLPSVELKDTEELLRGYRVSKTLKSKQDISRNY